MTFVAYPPTYVIIQPPPSPDDRKRPLSVTQLGLEAELPMLPTKTRLPKTAKVLRNWLMCFCMGGLMAVSVVSESIAQNINAQASSTTAPQDSKDSEAREALARGEALRANWTADSLRQAIDQYETAALLWTSISDSAHASETILKAGDVYFLLSEYPQAIKRYQSAEELGKKTGDWLVQATALSQMGRLQSYLGDMDLAQKQLTQSLDLFKRHEEHRSVIASNAYGEVLGNLAEVTYAKGDLLKASQQLDSALDIFQKYQEGEARVRLLKGKLAGSIGETDKAAAEISRALELYSELNEKSGVGRALTAMGLWHSSNQDESRAIEMHERAREIFRVIGDKYSEAVALNAMGQAYDNLTKYSAALSYHQSALELFENIGAFDAASGTICVIAMTQYRSGNPGEALLSYGKCLKSSRTAGNRRFEAYALKGIAESYGAQRRPELAIRQFQKLANFFKSIGDLRGQAMALNSYGDFFLQLKENQKALDVFAQAFSLSEKMGDKGMLIEMLYNLARANEALGLHDVALSLIRKSFKLIEEIRANVASLDFRASYFAAVRKHHDLCIEILMQLDRLRPGNGFAAEAFWVNEQGRARLLLDLLSESRANISAGAAKELVEEERRLRGLLRAQAEYQLNLSLSGKDPSEFNEVATQVTELTSQYQVVQAQLRKQNPRLFSFEHFAAVDLEHVQRELRGSDTILLEYVLGDEHSYLWAVTAESSDTFILPARRDIENAARELYESITARQGRDGQSEKDYQAEVLAADNLYFEKASKLSQMLLGPVAEKVQGRRILVVTDGALQYIPFEALPMPTAQTSSPGQSTTSLIETNEVVVLPSASTLLALRGVNKSTNSQGDLVAIIADPVFSTSDDRVQNEAPPGTAKAAAEQNPDQAEQQTINNLKLTRLVHASEEADSITTAAPWGTTLVAKGFDATREKAMSYEVGRAQIVHFATHGFLNSEHPELSSIVLAMRDRHGVKTNGLMPLPDIYSLDLSAQLVVLSACQTALGKDLKGEGFVGLSHSFMSAGAKSVVASLWKVDDRATASLMREFYNGMLQKGMTPSAALRSAKLKMIHDTQWTQPYYWAGFVLQGEYTNHIAVDRNAWMRPALVLLFALIVMAATLLALQKRKHRIPPQHFT